MLKAGMPGENGVSVQPPATMDPDSGSARVLIQLVEAAATIALVTPLRLKHARRLIVKVCFESVI